MSINFNAILYHKTSILTNQKLLLKKGKLENLFFIKNIAIIGKRDDIPLNKERLFVYNKEQTFFIEELFQWIMGSYQTESLFA